MLLELRIRNFAIIEQAALQFGPGLNVLSGETGAGKTIIMTALGLLLGARASPELIGAAGGEAVVEGLFELEGDGTIGEGIDGLPELGDGRELAIRRTITEGGRSRAYLNGELATIQMLAKIGAGLVQIYGQHEQQSLLRVESHLQVLDRHAGIGAVLDRYRDAWRTALAARATLDELAARERSRAELLELARFRVAELDRAAPLAGEDVSLAAERTVLANAARLAAAAAEAEEMLVGAERAALDAAARAEARITEVASLDSALRAPLELIAAGRVNLQEAADTLRAYAGRIEADPARLEEVDTRIAELNRLKRKYGGTLECAIETLESSRAEIAELEAIAEFRGKAEADLVRELDHLAEAAADLTRARRASAADMKSRMEAELKTLGMRAAVFEARFAPLDASSAGLVHNGAAFGPNGADAVEFMLSPNLGQPPMALARVASGGELSRVMLALKRLEAQRRGVATLIFDEVDSGVGGNIAVVVGRQLKQVARFHQVLCVTHLPQVAAFADTHFVVEKEERRGATRSRVTALAEADRIEELARMLGGAEASDRFRRAARELVGRASGSS